ncbi:hypothetical protein P8H26_06690 [Pseudochrobactrum sp. sp1633]|uniref:hypothetical protein n=1 Tax=Pseudochrobactrum sp. sp1633 TaxID=3036706 RepID=UPI0025A5440C|nr:hypothetical protein [Pseudochrobactrum sp. sp1633]MDM8345077.1 hypothetical protein [Pseudochrobactrum sp. sp1633]HWD14910.1 hypothetical protein [Pseudochrobactrum sp.]
MSMFERRHVFNARLLCLPLVALLAGCTGTATAWTEKVTIEKVELPKECAGWQKINFKQRAYYALMREDPALIMEIDSHNLKGKNLGCWE